MSSYVRTLEKRIMKRAGVRRVPRGWTFHMLQHVMGERKAEATVARLGEALADRDGLLIGWRWPRAIPARFLPEAKPLRAA